MSANRPKDGRGYWYLEVIDDESQALVLDSVWSFLEAERRFSDRMQRSLGLSVSELIAVRYLLAEENSGRKVRQRDLAKRLDITHASTSVMVDKLVRRGDLVRNPHPDDRRSLALQVTADGRKRVHDVFSRVHEGVLRGIRDLNDHDRAVVGQVMHTLAETLDERIVPDHTVSA